MTTLPDLYQKFHDAILSKDATKATPDIRAKGALTPQARMKIYIEGYRLRLRQAIASDYPALHDYLGADAFDSLAHGYIESTPPTHYNLDRYPFGFSAYVARHCNDPFGPSLAELEGAIAEVFMGPESDPLLLSPVAMENFADMVLQPRLASRLLKLSYPAHLWLAAQRAGETPASPQPAATNLYIYRHEHEVQQIALSAQAYRFFTALAAGESVGSALESVPNLSESETQSCFAEWLGKGAFRA